MDNVMAYVGVGKHGKLDEYDDEDFSLERDSFAYDDCPYHAPSAFVEAQRVLRAERKRRDRNELQDLWREETQARKREHAARFLRGHHA
jgi:hypothetical protein